MESKAEQRARIRAELAKLTPIDRAVASAQIAARLAALPLLQKITSIALFAPLASEPVLGWGWKMFPLMAVPRLVGNNLELRQVTDAAELVRTPSQPGWQLLEPPETAPFVPHHQIEAILVPGVAFDRSGRRLGRGGGYYDRLLYAMPPTTKKIGVFFAAQELVEIAFESHDQRLDMIVTEQATIET